MSGPRCSQIQRGFNASPFSGPDNAGSLSDGSNVHLMLNDPEVRSLVRVNAQGLPVRLPGRLLPDKTPVSAEANKASCDKELSASPGRLAVRQSEPSRGFRGDSGLRRATPFADDFAGDLGHGSAAPSADFRQVDGGGQVASFAGESDRNHWIAGEACACDCRCE